MSVVAQRLPRGGVNRNQPILAELGLPNVQHTVNEVYVSAVQAQRLARAQSRADQQSDHRCQHQGAARILSVLWRNRHQTAKFISYISRLMGALRLIESACLN
jgi:hypothetical protein